MGIKENFSYQGWENCIRMTNKKIELVVVTDIGPRILRFGEIGGQNLFKEYSDDMGKTGGDKWRIFGGHRFWHAPEAISRTYFPDNNKVDYSISNQTVKLVQDIERTTGIRKEVDITLDSDLNMATVVHRLINKNLWEVKIAPWALSVMNQEGQAIIPQEPYQTHDENLLPARPLVLWHYTDMSDPRWRWGEKYIQLIQDPKMDKDQKVGMRNARGWAAYYLKGQVFIKRFKHDLKAEYVDMGCNNEIYTNKDMLELETLGPIEKLSPGASLEHTEYWFYYKVTLDGTEESIDKNLLPYVLNTGEYTK